MTPSQKPLFARLVDDLELETLSNVKYHWPLILVSFVISFLISLVAFFPQKGYVEAQVSCTFYTTTLPLTDLGSGEYMRITDTDPLTYVATGHIGGLYSGGSNTRPAGHQAAGLTAASQITPLDSAGSPNANGKIGLISIGMSNTSMEWGTFMTLANADPQKNTKVKLVNGALSGSTIDRWIDPESPTYQIIWDNVTTQVNMQGLTDAQVQVAWVKITQGPYQPNFPSDMQALTGMYEELARLLKARFPNLRITYFSSRTRSYVYHMGLSPEPTAFENAFAVRWMIDDQIAGTGNINYDPGQGTVVASYITWGAYLWIDGENPRLDGRTWPLTNVDSGDCTHPTQDGQDEVADMLLDYFKTDETSTSWFLEGGVTPTPTPIPTATSTPTPTPTSTPTPTPIPPTSTPTTVPTSVPTATPTSTPTPTVTPQTSFAPSYPSQVACNSVTPAPVPEIFQIDVTTRSATLHIKPAGGEITGYSVFYGLAPGEERFASMFSQGPSGGAITHKINELNPNTQYYFKIVAHNDCATSKSSLIIPAKTTRFFFQSKELTVVKPSRTQQPVILSPAPTITGGEEPSFVSPTMALPGASSVGTPSEVGISSLWVRAVEFLKSTLSIFGF